ncbi:MAG: hypothetical protein ABUK01_16725 [Leptospirales bacterium]
MRRNKLRRKRYEKNIYHIDKLFDSFKSNALISLKTALVSYMEATHETFGSRYEEASDEYHMIDINLQFLKGYTETIIHFHHFIELSLKEILRGENEVFTVDFKNPKVAFSDIIEMTYSDKDSIYREQTVTFIEAWSRIKILINHGKLSEYKDIMDGWSPAIHFLNKLRNSIWHRGTLVME